VAGFGCPLTNYKREHATLFDTGNYLPLQVVGAKRDHICAFAWKTDVTLIVAVPRLVVGLTRKASLAPLGTEIWSDTRLILSKKLRGERFLNIFTGETIKVSHESQAFLTLADIFGHFPVAIIELAT